MELLICAQIQKRTGCSRKRSTLAPGRITLNLRTREKTKERKTPCQFKTILTLRFAPEFFEDFHLYLDKDKNICFLTSFNWNKVHGFSHCENCPFAKLYSKGSWLDAAWGLLNMYINLSFRFWKITINYKRIIEFPVDEIRPNPHLSTDLNLLRPIFWTNLCKGSLELRVVFCAGLFEAGFWRVETKAGWNMTVPRKCINQPPAGEAVFKCLGLKSLSCGHA